MQKQFLPAYGYRQTCMYSLEPLLPLLHHAYIASRRSQMLGLASAKFISVKQQETNVPLQPPWLATFPVFGKPAQASGQQDQPARALACNVLPNHLRISLQKLPARFKQAQLKTGTQSAPTHVFRSPCDIHDLFASPTN